MARSQLPVQGNSSSNWRSNDLDNYLLSGKNDIYDLVIVTRPGIFESFKIAVILKPTFFCGLMALENA
jgi:hypothetical protein